MVAGLGAGFGVYRYYRSQQATPTAWLETPPEEVIQPTEMATGEEFVIEENFSIGGYLLQDDLGGWIVLYDDVQTGAVAAKNSLAFTNDSLCNFGQGEKKCDLSTFEVGTQIEVEGRQSGNELTVIKMKKIAGP